MKRTFEQRLSFVRDAVKIDTGLEYFKKEDHYFCFLPSLDKQTLITFGEMVEHLIKINPGDEITGMNEHHNKRKFLGRMVGAEINLREKGLSKEPDLEHDIYHRTIYSMFMATMQPYEDSWGETAVTELSGLDKSSLDEIQRNRLMAAIDLTRETNKTFDTMFRQMTKAN